MPIFSRPSPDSLPVEDAASPMETVLFFPRPARGAGLRIFPPGLIFRQVFKRPWAREESACTQRKAPLNTGVILPFVRASTEEPSTKGEGEGISTTLYSGELRGGPMLRAAGPSRRGEGTGPSTPWNRALSPPSGSTRRGCSRHLRRYRRGCRSRALLPTHVHRTEPSPVPGAVIALSRFSRHLRMDSRLSTVTTRLLLHCQLAECIDERDRTYKAPLFFS